MRSPHVHPQNTRLYTNSHLLELFAFPQSLVPCSRQSCTSCCGHTLRPSSSQNVAGHSPGCITCCILFPSATFLTACIDHRNILHGRTKAGHACQVTPTKRSRNSAIWECLHVNGPSSSIDWRDKDTHVMK
ncbi:hypothetical protein BKA93DRAFT_70648 [Sparassis latifolia]